uniref:Uncharacterized protein n=1 Tax=viral metagenome TaxID=1070528 RepID=A0A6M3JGC8_9ZZZZ
MNRQEYLENEGHHIKEDAQDYSDICICGHNIQEHEAVMDCKCYVYGCDCEGFEARE